MQKSSAGGNNFDDEREQGGPEPVIGDADNVQKTSYVVGRGTDPAGRDPDARDLDPSVPATDEPGRRGEADGYAATVRPGGGVNIGLWVVVALAVLVALVYGVGVFT